MKDKRAEKMKKHYNILLNGTEFKVLNCIVSSDKKTLGIRTKIFGQQFPRESFVMAELPTDEGEKYISLKYTGMGSTEKMEFWEYKILHNDELNIELLSNEADVREKFKKRHTLSWEDFQVTHITFDKQKYEESYLWDLMPINYIEVSFEDALKMLKAKKGDVLFMSEDNRNSGFHGLKLKDKKIQTFLAKADAQGLAELIEQEWYESYLLSELEMYNPEAVLPEDLYVFDLTMEWVISFTHEITCDWELEWDEPMKAAESRLCILSV